ncbi:MAG TPA: MMPL family transporter, partial [Desulfobacterales bacterium]|nr:MMPL family transporter [Desulfobacterales bacterium]
MSAVWVAVLAALAAVALSLGGSLSQDFQIPGTESDRAQALLIERFGAQASGIGSGTGSRTSAEAAQASARMVVAAPPDQNLLAGGLQTVLIAVAPLAQVPGVAAVSDPVITQAIAPDGSVVYLDLQFTTTADDVSPATVDQVRGVADSLGNQGFEVAVTGGPFTEPLSLLSGAEAIGVVFALIVLVITLGSMLAASIPILTALAGVGIGAAGVLAVAATVDMSAATLALALMLGLAVGIDYALFLLSRYRQELSTGIDPLESAARTVSTAGNAVVLAGATTIIALVALSLVGIPFLTLMGLAAAGTVAVAVLIALTMVPAMMGFAGARLTPRGRAARDIERSVGSGNRWGSLITRHPLVTVAVATVLLAVVALPVLDLELGLPDAGGEPKTSASRQAHDMLADGFGPGFNSPLVVLVDAAEGDLQAAVGVVTQGISELPNVAHIAQPMPNPQGDAALVVVVPQTASNTRATSDLVHAIRDLRPGVEQQTGTGMWVTGAAAANVDISRMLADALPQFLLIVVGLA